jgi:hypothetical protein
MCEGDWPTQLSVHLIHFIKRRHTHTHIYIPSSATYNLSSDVCSIAVLNNHGESKVCLFYATLATNGNYRKRNFSNHLQEVPPKKLDRVTTGILSDPTSENTNTLFVQISFSLWILDGRHAVLHPTKCARFRRDNYSTWQCSTSPVYEHDKKLCLHGCPC